MGELRDRLDEVLDDALASYGETPENEGLEQRILARITEAANAGIQGSVGCSPLARQQQP